MILLTIVLVVGVAISIFTTINLLRKNEKQEDILSSYMLYLDRISRCIELSDNRLKEIDAKGTQIQAILNEFQVREVSKPNQPK